MIHHRNQREKTHFNRVKINIQKCIFVVNTLHLCYYALQLHQWCRSRELKKAGMWVRRMWSSSAVPDPIHPPVSLHGSGQCPQNEQKMKPLSLAMGFVAGIINNCHLVCQNLHVNVMARSHRSKQGGFSKQSEEQKQSVSTEITSGVKFELRHWSCQMARYTHRDSLL